MPRPMKGKRDTPATDQIREKGRTPDNLFGSQKTYEPAPKISLCTHGTCKIKREINWHLKKLTKIEFKNLLN